MNLFPGCEGVTVLLYALLWCFGMLGVVAGLLVLGVLLDRWLDEDD